jgi:hypothetical protein
VLRAVIALCVVCVLASGCAGVARLPEESWVVRSEPSGAEARLSTGQHCTTPCKLRLPRRNAFEIILSKPGYQDFTFDVKPNPAPLGALTRAGMGLVDYGLFSGTLSEERAKATYDVSWVLQPNPLVVKLTPKP